MRKVNVSGDRLFGSFINGSDRGRGPCSTCSRAVPEPDDIVGNGGKIFGIHCECLLQVTVDGDMTDTTASRCHLETASKLEYVPTYLTIY